jgi:predicted dehydrogenase
MSLPRPREIASDVSAFPTRRDFLHVAGATAGLYAGMQAEGVLGYAANDTINVACIGTGGRCRHLMQSLRLIPNVRIAAVCDVYDVNLEAGAKMAAAGAIRSKNFHEILANKDIHAVLIGAPDHWHVPMTIAACAAGKDVYVEKPLTHSLEEGQAVIDAQNNHKRVVQVGTQQRSMPQYQKAREVIQSGKAGTIYKVHMTWNRNSARSRRAKQGVDPKQIDWKAFCGSAPEQPFDDYKMRQWRWFWDFGGGLLTDLMVHQVDIVHWIMGVDHPDSACAIGNHFNSKGAWQTPDTIQALMQYGDKFLGYYEGTFVNARNNAMIEFMGTDATVYVDRGRYELYPERNKKVPADSLVLGSGPKGQDFYDKPEGELLHLTNWIECIRTRAKPIAPAEAGVSAASAAHLGNLAYRSGQVAHWKEGAKH